MPNAKEMQISRDEKIAQCLDLLKLIIDHLEIKQPDCDSKEGVSER
jgi:hypothetical protein